MEVGLKQLLYMFMYYYPNPTTEKLERLVWVYERNETIQTLVFEWEGSAGYIPVSPEVRAAMDELMIGKHIMKITVMKNTTGNKQRRNYRWQLVADPQKSPYYRPRILSKRERKVFRVLATKPKRLRILIRNHKNSIMTKKQMYNMLVSEFITNSMVRPKRRRRK